MSACQDRQLYGLNHLHYLTVRRHAALTRAGRRSKMSSVPQQRHFYSLNHLHYITTSTYRRARVFDSERFKRRFVSTWTELRGELGFRIVGYVLKRPHAGTLSRSALALRASQPLTDHAEAGRAHGKVHSEKPP
jgi:hypothetical protein